MTKLLKIAAQKRLWAFAPITLALTACGTFWAEYCCGRYG